MASSEAATLTTECVTPPISLIDDMPGHSVDFSLSELNNEVDLIDLSPDLAAVKVVADTDLTGGITIAASLDHQISFAPAKVHKFAISKLSLGGSSPIPDDHYRTIIFNNVRSWNEGTDLSRILARVRGGAVESAVMVNTNPWAQGNSALITFTNADGAQNYLKQLENLAHGDLNCMGCVFDILGFGTVTLVRTPAFPRTPSLGQFASPSRHIVVEGVENKYLMTFIVHIAERFRKPPSEFFDEAYVEPQHPRPLTTKDLASPEFKYNTESNQQDFEEVLKIRENKIGIKSSQQLHLVLYSIADAAKVQGYLTRDFACLNNHAASLNFLRVRTAPDPCASSMHDLSTCMEDSPLSGATLTDRPYFVSNTGLVTNPVNNPRQRHISLLQLFGCRIGKHFEPKNMAENVMKTFGWQHDFREDFSPQYFDPWSSFHPIADSIWKVPLELRPDGAETKMAFKHRIEMEMKARNTGAVVRAKPGLVDIFTQLDREHRGVAPPAKMPVLTAPRPIENRISMHKQFFMANEIVEAIVSVGGEKASWMLEGLTANDCIKLTQFLQKMIRLAYKTKSAVYDMLIKAGSSNALGPKTAEFLRKCEEETKAMWTSDGVMDINSNRQWLDLAQIKLKEEAAHAQAEFPIWFSLSQDRAAFFLNRVAPIITIPDNTDTEFPHQTMPDETARASESAHDWFIRDPFSHTRAASGTSLIDLHSYTSPENVNTSPNMGTRSGTPPTSLDRHLISPATPEDSDIDWDDEVDPMSPTDSILRGVACKRD